MTRINQIKAIERAAANVGGTVRNDYSGRGMFGARCYGIDCDNAARAIEEAAALGVRGAKVDNMGMGWIVYWPSIQGV